MIRSLTRSKISTLSLILLAAASAAGAQAASLPHRKGKIPLMGKPSAPIEFAYEVSGSGAQGSQVTVKVDISFLAQADDIQVSLTPGTGIEAGSGEFQSSFATQSSGAKITRRVTVIPRTNELSYLNVTARGRFAGGVMSRVGSIPVNPNAGVSILKSGSAKAQAGGGPSSGGQGTLKKDSQGNDVVSMPAVEPK